MQTETKRELEPWLATALLIYAWDVPVNRFAKCVYACIGGYLEMFLGYTGGSMGEVSALALLIGFLYLLYRKG